MGTSSPEEPTEGFMKKLLSIAVSMGDSSEFEELFPIKEKQTRAVAEKCRIIRSFLLQYLIELRYNINPFIFDLFLYKVALKPRFTAGN